MRFLSIILLMILTSIARAEDITLIPKGSGGENDFPVMALCSNSSADLAFFLISFSFDHSQAPDLAGKELIWAFYDEQTQKRLSPLLPMKFKKNNVNVNLTNGSAGYILEDQYPDYPKRWLEKILLDLPHAKILIFDADNFRRYELKLNDIYNHQDWFISGCGE